MQDDPPHPASRAARRGEIVALGAPGTSDPRRGAGLILDLEEAVEHPVEALRGLGKPSADAASDTVDLGMRAPGGVAVAASSRATEALGLDVLAERNRVVREAVSGAVRGLGVPAFDHETPAEEGGAPAGVVGTAVAEAGDLAHAGARRVGSVLDKVAAVRGARATIPGMGSAGNRIPVLGEAPDRVPPARQPHHRPDLSDEWHDPQGGEIGWPPNDWFDAPPTRREPEPGWTATAAGSDCGTVGGASLPGDRLRAPRAAPRQGSAEPCRLWGREAGPGPAGPCGAVVRPVRPARPGRDRRVGARGDRRGSSPAVGRRRAS